MSVILCHGNNMTFVYELLNEMQFHQPSQFVRLVQVVKLHLIKKIVAQSIRSNRSSGETASH